MSSPNRNSVVAIVLAGCSTMFGLDATDRDSDHDDVPNERDNCPYDYNKNQDPAACAACTATSGRDVDQDSRDDACDACIGEPIGADTNANDIDDGCEGCFLGESTVVFDADGDGELDGCDTCIYQSGVDIDRDGIDDNCDVCPAGPNGDADGDGVNDWCDNCPVVANADQAIASDHGSDRDELGDACDPSLGTNQSRRMFDAFADVRMSQWFEPAWPIVDGQARARFETGDTVQWSTTTYVSDYFGLWVAARVELSGDADAAGGILLDHIGPGTGAIDGSRIVCEVERTSGSTNVYTSIWKQGALSERYQGGKTLEGSTFRLAVQLTPNATGQTSVTCIGTGVGEPQMTAPAAITPYGFANVALVAHATPANVPPMVQHLDVGFDYLEIIEGFYGGGGSTTNR